MEEKFPPLEVECSECKGSGKETNPNIYYSSYPYKDKCDGCDGLGEVLTPFGDAVLEFVKKYYRISLKIQ